MTDDMAETAMGVPGWTLKEEKRGIDPLAMQTTSVALYQELLPGISNVTLRIRYYGIYSWLADSFARDVHDRTIEVWCRYIRRAEALYALVAAFDGTERGVVGVNWATRKLESTSRDKISFHANTDRHGQPQYLTQKFGAFGAAYGSQLRAIGLLDECEDHDIPIPSQGIGDDLAKAFRAAIGPIGTEFLAAAEVGMVTKPQLKRMAPMLPSRIGKQSRERQLYENLLFGKIGPKSDSVASRSQTLRLVLHTARAHQSDVDASYVRWSLYAKRTASGETLPSLAAEGEKQRLYWAVYHANDLLHVTYEALLEYTLGILSTTPAGLDLNVLVEKVSTRLANALAIYDATTWSELLDSVEPPENAWSDDHPLSEFTLAHDLLSRTNPTKVTPDDFGANALLLLAVLQKKWGSMVDRIAEQRPTLVKESFSRSLITELRFLDANAASSLQLVIAKLVKTRVIERHLWVAVRKLRSQGDYTFLLEADEGRVRVRRKDGPVFTTPRLASAIAFLYDIKLLEEQGPTKAGLAALEHA